MDKGRNAGKYGLVMLASLSGCGGFTASHGPGYCDAYEPVYFGQESKEAILDYGDVDAAIAVIANNRTYTRECENEAK